MDTGCVKLLPWMGRKVFSDCTVVEDELDVTMHSGQSWATFIYNDPLGYADLILNGNPENT